MNQYKAYALAILTALGVAIIAFFVFDPLQVFAGVQVGGGGTVFALPFTITNNPNFTSSATTTNLFGSLMPQVNNLYDLGSTSTQWRNGFFGGTVSTTNITVNGTITSGGSSTSSFGLITAGSVSTSQVLMNGGTINGSTYRSAPGSLNLTSAGTGNSVAVNFNDPLAGNGGLGVYDGGTNLYALFWSNSYIMRPLMITKTSMSGIVPYGGDVLDIIGNVSSTGNLTVSGNLYATGTSSILGGATINGNTTLVNSTSTSLFVTSFLGTSATTTNAFFTNILATAVTSTSLFSTNYLGTAATSTSGFFTSLGSTNSVATNATTTNQSVTNFAVGASVNTLGQFSTQPVSMFYSSSSNAQQSQIGIDNNDTNGGASIAFADGVAGGAGGSAALIALTGGTIGGGQPTSTLLIRSSGTINNGIAFAPGGGATTLTLATGGAVVDTSSLTASSFISSAAGSASAPEYVLQGSGAANTGLHSDSTGSAFMDVAGSKILGAYSTSVAIFANLVPSANNADNLGSPVNSIKNIYVSSTIFAATVSSTNVTTANATLNGGTINNMTIGQTVAAAVSSTVFSTQGTVTLTGIPVSGGGDGFLCLGTNNTVSSQSANCTVSSARFKNHIASLSPQELLTEVNKLRAVSFNWKDGSVPSGGTNGGGRASTGFVAEEVAAIDPQLVVYAVASPDDLAWELIHYPDSILYKDGKSLIPQTVDYARVSYLTVGAIQAQEKRLDTLSARLDAIDHRVGLLEKIMNWVKSEIKSLLKHL